MTDAGRRVVRGLDWIWDLLRRQGVWCARRPRATLLLLGLATVGFSVGLFRLKLTANFDETELPSEDPKVKSSLRVKQVFGTSTAVTLVIEVPEGDSVYSARHLALVRRLSEELKHHGLLVPDDVTSLTEATDVALRGESLDSRRIISFPITAAQAREVAARVRANPMWAGRLVDASGRRTLLVTNKAPRASSDALYDALRQILSSIQPPVRAWVSGGDVLPVAMTRSIRQDLNVFIPLALLLVAVGFYLSFFTVAGVVLPFAVTGLCLYWMMGAMGLLGIPLNPVTNALPAAMVSIASSYGVHFMSHYYLCLERHPGSNPVAEAAAQVAKPIWLTGIISAVGMISLVTFRVEMIRQFGVVISMGIIFALLISMTLTPALLALRRVKAWKPKPPGRLSRWLPHLGAACATHPWTTVAFSVLLTVLAGLAVLRLQVGIDLPNFFPRGHPQREVNKLIGRELGGAAEMTLMVSPDRRAFPDGTRSPKFLDQLMRFQEQARRIPGVGHVQSLADLVYHINGKIQSSLRREDGESAMPPELGAVLPNRGERPRSRAHVDQLLLLFSLGGGMYAIDRLEDAAQSHAAVRISLTSWDQLEHRQVLEGVRSLFARHFGATAGLTAGGDAVVMIAFDEQIIWGKLANVASSFPSVLICCALVYWSIRQGLLCLIPVSVATLATFALMGLMNIRLSMATATISSLTIGVGVDVAIYFLDDYRTKLAGGSSPESSLDATMREVGPAIIYNSGSNILGFAPLVLSGLVPVQHFGWLISFSLLFSGVATLTIMPAMLKLGARSRR